MKLSEAEVRVKLERWIHSKYIDEIIIPEEQMHDDQYHIIFNMEEMLFRYSLTFLVEAAGFELDVIDGDCLPDEQSHSETRTATSVTEAIRLRPDFNSKYANYLGEIVRDDKKFARFLKRIRQQEVERQRQTNV